MNTIIPVSELKNDFEIYCKLAEAERNEEKNHKYYTIDDAWEAMTKAIEKQSNINDFEVYYKLLEAEREEESNPRYYTMEEVREMAFKAARSE